MTYGGLHEINKIFSVLLLRIVIAEQFFIPNCVYPKEALMQYTIFPRF